MERHEFDLNDYSLEVGDGKAVLERRQRFKPGDVLKNNSDDIVIYAETNEDGGIIIYCSYNIKRERFTDKRTTYFGYDFHYATEEQKAILFAEIDERGYVWDAEKLELRKKRWRAKKGKIYWIADSTGEPKQLTEDGVDWDDVYYSAGNYFRTKEKAEEAAEEIRKVFEKYKEE